MEQRRPGGCACSFSHTTQNGGMAERFKAAVLKTARVKALQGSNPCPTATLVFCREVVRREHS